MPSELRAERSAGWFPVKRREAASRADLRPRFEAQGLVARPSRGPDSTPGACYELTAAEVETVATASAELHAMCIAAVGRVVRDRRYAELGLGSTAVELVERSWNRRDPAFFGRLDLALGPDGVPKLLEYSADTPDGLLDVAGLRPTPTDGVEPRDPGDGLRDPLVARWRALRPRLGPVVHFACGDELDDRRDTFDYVRDTAHQAGLATRRIELAHLRLDPARGELLDREGRPITSVFKLCPWQRLAVHPLGAALANVSAVWLEPAWKLVLANRGILPILWQLFPDHPNLLAASPERDLVVGDAWVRKPLIGGDGQPPAGPVGDRGYVYQAYAELGDHDGMHPVIGSWLVGDTPAGLGIRETPAAIPGHAARFVPHGLAP